MYRNCMQKRGCNCGYNKNYDNEYYWWECEKVTDENILNNIKCGDGEYIEGGKSDKYRNVTILSCNADNDTNDTFFGTRF